MQFYSTNNRALTASLREAVIQGMAPDNGLYMPENLPVMPKDFFARAKGMSFPAIAWEVSSALLGESVPDVVLREIVEHTVSFDAPLVRVEEGIYALELFHGPTLAFKDFGARFMSRMLGHFAREQHQEIVILVATSGDTGSAVANGFLGVEGTRVIVLYPSGKVSTVQEKQFTTLGRNVTALEVNGTFDDCQRLVKLAFADELLRRRFFLTSANSINIARLIPQSFYYFRAWAQLPGLNQAPVFSVPSGNFGNLTAGLLAMRMGLPVKRFVAATNINDVVPEFMRTGSFNPRASASTISNAMDVGNPSNFVRLLKLFNEDRGQIREMLSASAHTDEETRAVMRRVFSDSGYVLDPHGAVGYLGLKSCMEEQQIKGPGIFLETAHPAKFIDVVEPVLGRNLELPPALAAFMERDKESVPMENSFEGFRSYLLENL